MSWIETYTGQKFDVLNPDPNKINMLDIANGLSKTCRFGGQCSNFYSVAQHSTLLSMVVDDDLAIAALLHDASEAYIGDVVRPLKRQLSLYKEIEDKLQGMIYSKYGICLTKDQEKDLKLYDSLLLYKEGIDFGMGVRNWGIDQCDTSEPLDLDEKILPATWECAYDLFIQCWQLLGLPED